MDEARVGPRILVAQPAVAAPLALDVVGALQRGLAGASIECVSDAARCLERFTQGGIDLVVADDALGPVLGEILERLGALGFPVLVIQRDASDARALALVERGAAHCVAPGPDAARRLVAAARAQLSRGAEPMLREAQAASPRGLAGDHASIIQNLNSALLVVDPAGRVIYCNPPAESILGERAERLRGEPIWDWFRGVPRDQVLLARSIERGERFKGTEAAITRPDGTIVPVGISCAPLEHPEGRRGGAVAVFQDLSEAKQLQSHALQTEKMASIGHLAAGVAHEINNPMGFIHANLFQMAEYVADLRRVWGKVESLQKATAASDPQAIGVCARDLAEAAEEVDVPFLLSDLAKAIRESQEGSERIRHIVQDLRDFSYQDTGERALADINQCLDSTANIVWPMMKHLVQLEKCYAELPVVSCYPMQLKQVFMNLLVNACHAIEDAVAGTDRTGTIRLESLRRGDEVLVCVADTGSGISPEHIDRIFDPFFTTKRPGAGTGLGLSTSFAIVQRHGGTLTVESAPGAGAIFRVRLPIAPEPSPGSA